MFEFSPGEESSRVFNTSEQANVKSLAPDECLDASVLMNEENATVYDPLADFYPFFLLSY